MFCLKQVNYKCCFFCVAILKLQSEWEAVSLELEHWVVCVRQLEDVLVLQMLLLVPPTVGAAGGPAALCSIKTLLEGGSGSSPNHDFFIVFSTSFLSLKLNCRLSRWHH